MTEQGQTGPVIVGVDGSERSNDALALADRLGAALRLPVLIAYVHPFTQVSSLFAPGEYERLVREVAESTVDQVREYLRSVPEPRMKLVSDTSPAAGLHAIAEREAATLIVIGSSHHSRIGRVLVGGTGERLLSAPRHPSPSLPPAMRPTTRRCALWVVGSTGRRSLTGHWPGRLSLHAQHRRGFPC